MSKYFELIIMCGTMLVTTVATFAGGIFAYHKFVINSIEGVRKELYKEISKLKDDSDKRDEEIKESIKDLKRELSKRDEDIKSYIKELKDDLKEYFNLKK